MMTDQNTSFNSSDEFWKHVREQAGGDRTEIQAVASPMIYTDIEDKIEQLRERINRLDALLEVQQTAIMSILRRDTGQWKKPKSSKRPKLSKS